MLAQLLNAESQQARILPRTLAPPGGQGLGSVAIEGDWILGLDLLQAGRRRPPENFSRTTRDLELKWRREHEDFLRAYAGQWVVVDGECLAAHGESLKEVVETARQLGIALPYVFRAEALADDVVTIGL